MSKKKTATRAKRTTTRKKARGTEESARYKKALETFERAIKTLHKGDLEKARTQFDGIVSGFPEESEVADRARTFLSICDRRQRDARGYSPKDVESLVSYGVFLHNKGEFKEAVARLSKAVEMDPKSDHAQYCLAASYARMGDAREATRYLKRAITADPYNRVLALTDADFDSVRKDSSVSQMLATTT
jgi:tetratricopeptide (TPR) repeat protein